MMEEGMMTLLRKNVVSNARLIKCADGRGLRVRSTRSAKKDINSPYWGHILYIPGVNSLCSGAYYYSEASVERGD